MLADELCRTEIVALVDKTYARMSMPDSNPNELMFHEDMTVSGSGLGELAYGPEVVGGMAKAVASWGFTWTAETVTVWREGDVAWAQILGSVHVTRDGKDEHVPYWTTGVFAKNSDGWHWRYWGGAEPQEFARV